MDYDALIQETIEEITDEQNKLEHVTILIAGKSGVGKSTLINAAFGDHLAETGVGRPVTKNIQLIEKKGMPLKIYDTVGLELDNKARKKTTKEIKKIVQKTRKNNIPDDDVHCVWYCVAAPSDRFEEIEEKFIHDIAKFNIPIILVLTKVFSRSSANKLEAAIWKLNPKVNSIVQVLANDSEHISSFGVKELVEKTCDLLPDSVQNSFINVQKASLELKRKKAYSFIKLSVGTTFGEGFIPIPVADAPFIISTQMGMLVKITTIYGIDIKKNKLETTLASIAGVLVATSAGKTAVSSLLKMIPGAGSIVGGLISGSVAASITTALGYSYVELMELVVLGKIDLSSIAPDELVTLFTDMLSAQMSSVVK